jgi:hypothetical protein
MSEIHLTELNSREGLADDSPTTDTLWNNKPAQNLASVDSVRINFQWHE